MRACYRYCSTSCLDGWAKQNRFESDTHITDARYWLRGMAGCGTEIRGDICTAATYTGHLLPPSNSVGRSKVWSPILPSLAMPDKSQSQDSATGSTASTPCEIADSMIHDVWWRSEGKPRIMHQSPRLGRPARASVLSMNPNRTRRVSSVAFLKSK